MVGNNDDTDRTDVRSGQELALGRCFDITGQQNLKIATRNAQYARCVISHAMRIRCWMQKTIVDAVVGPSISRDTFFRRAEACETVLAVIGLLNGQVLSYCINAASVIVVGVRNNQPVNRKDPPVFQERQQDLVRR